MMSKDDLKVYQEAIEKRVQNLKTAIAQYEENDFGKHLDLKLALCDVANAANDVAGVLDRDHSW